MTNRPTDGWNTERLRRVQEMELKDRQAGVTEAEIVSMRVTRQQEVEVSMMQELKVSDKRKLFESKSTKPLFPAQYKASAATTPKKTADGSNNSNSATKK